MSHIYNIECIRFVNLSFLWFYEEHAGIFVKSILYMPACIHERIPDVVEAGFLSLSANLPSKKSLISSLSLLVIALFARHMEH